MKVRIKLGTDKPKEGKVNEEEVKPKVTKGFTEAEIETRYQAHLVKVTGGK